MGEKKKNNNQKLALWCSEQNLCLQHQHPVRTQVCNPAAALLIQLPDNAPGESSQDGPRAWAPNTRWSLRLQTWPDPGTATVVI